MSIEIVPATFSHAEQLAETLRAGDAMEIQALGFTPLEALDAMLCHSLDARAALIDGEVAALWGFATQCLLGDTVDLWCFTGSLSDQHQTAFARRSRDFVLEMQNKFKELRALVALDYAKSVRWLHWLGFEDGNIEIYGGRKFMRVVRNDRH